MQRKTDKFSLANRGISLKKVDWLYTSISTIVVKTDVVCESKKVKHDSSLTKF